MQNLSVEEHQNHAGGNNKSQYFLISSKKHQKFSDTITTHGFAWKVRWNVRKSEQFQCFATLRSHSKTVGRGFESSRPCQEKSLTQSRWAFFNEIHPIGWVKSPQTAVKLSFGQWNSPYGEWVDFISPRTKWVISPERSEDFTFCEAKYFTFLFRAMPCN